MHWDTATPWFDVTVIVGLFAVGSICFGRFEEHRPRWRRLLKLVVVTAAFVTLSEAAGRGVALAALTVPLGLAAYVHLVWLPRHGVNGWTAEPRERYLELVAGRRTGSSA